MFVIPSKTEKKWEQSNKSDIAGTLQRTRNMDFDQEGYAKLAKRTRAIYELAGDRRVLWIKYYQATNKYWFMTFDSGKIFSIDGTTLAVTDETSTNNVPSPDTVAGRNDAVYWQGYMYATSYSTTAGRSTLRRYNLASGWSANQYGDSSIEVASALTNAGFMAVHEEKNALAITQQGTTSHTVILLDTSHSLLQTLTIPAEFVPTSMDYAAGFLVIGTRNINNGEAKVFTWDGASALGNGGWGVGSSRVDSVRRYKNSFVVINGLGQLLKFNGGGFDMLDALPVYYKEVDWDYDGSSVFGRVINRGMEVDGELIYINLSPRIILPSTDLNAHVFENYFEGGVWCYDPKVKLHHRYCHTASLRVSNTITTANVNTTDNIITVSATAPVSGTPVIYDSSGSTAIGGLTNRTKYYIIYVSSTTIKLATSYENALAGTAIDLTGTGNNSQLLIYVPNRDFGGSTLGGNGINVDAAGALTLVSNKELTYRTDAAQVMFGTRIGKTTIGGSYGVAVATFGQENRGFLMTPKLHSSVITDTWQNIAIKYHGVNTVEDKIVVKYRTIERTDSLTGIDQGLTMTGVWVNTSRFTTTADISAAKKGDEVSFHSGSGSGYIAHISSISESGGTYTVNLDEVVQNVTAADTVGFVVENWNKLGVITTTDNDTFTNANGDRYSSDSGTKSFIVDKQSKWLEIKVELRGEDVMIEEILVNNQPFKKFIA